MPLKRFAMRLPEETCQKIGKRAFRGTFGTGMAIRYTKHAILEAHLVHFMRIRLRRLKPHVGCDHELSRYQA
jgi:hypothetical protein